MSPDKPSKPTKLCPTCGTRVSEDATRCLVCGTDLVASEKSSRAPRAVQGSRMPEVTLSLPAVMGMVAFLLTIGAGMVWYAMRPKAGEPVAAVPPTLTATITETLSPSTTPTAVTPTVTNTPLPSPTPQTYKVNQNDTCGGIAFAFGVSIQSIVLLNNLPADCSALYVGQELMIPYPTPTASPFPTSTLNPEEATREACSKVEYIVQEGDTLGIIAANYQVAIEAIRDYNGLVTDVVRFGQKLEIPLCKRSATPGPTPTATPPPPYAAPNPLLPPDGAAFTLNDETVTLQWASVGALRSNEAYAILYEDVTEGQGHRQVQYVTDTKFIVPTSFRPKDTQPHVIRWWVTTVRQTGTDDDGNPVWESAGTTSSPRVFTWSGVASSSP